MWEALVEMRMNKGGRPKKVENIIVSVVGCTACKKIEI